MELNIKKLNLVVLFLGTLATINNSYAKCPGENDIQNADQLTKGETITADGSNFTVEVIHKPKPSVTPWRLLLSKEGRRRCVYHVLPAPSDNAFIAGKLVLLKERHKK